MDDFDFKVYDLDGASVAGPSFSELEFDKTDYTPLEQFVENICHLPKKPVRLSPKKLSVNGRVVADRMDKYLAHVGESSSLLKEALKSPRHYYIAKQMELKPRTSHSFDFGTFVHSAILEPSKFNKVRVLPEANLSTLEGCRTMVRYYSELLGSMYVVDISELKIGELRSELMKLSTKAAEEGYTFIKAEDAQIINIIRVCYNTYGGGMLPKIMRYIQPEVSMYGRDLETGLKVKIRPDGLLLAENFGVNAILSVKTTSATSVDAFYRDAAKYRYELAEGMYLKVASEVTGRQFTATIMLMVQNVAPFQMALIYWDAEDLQTGKYKYAQALDVVKSCRETNQWNGFDAFAEDGNFGIIKGKLPQWIKAELMPQ